MEDGTPRHRDGNLSCGLCAMDRRCPGRSNRQLAALLFWLSVQRSTDGACAVWHPPDRLGCQRRGFPGRCDLPALLPHRQETESGNLQRTGRAAQDFCFIKSFIDLSSIRQRNKEGRTMLRKMRITARWVALAGVMAG